MVDFGELRAKAEDFVAEHDDQVKQGIGKVGDFVGNKIGHDKVDGIQDKLTGLVDSLGHPSPDDQAAGETPAPPAV
jgi:hypothetical protein